MALKSIANGSQLKCLPERHTYESALLGDDITAQQACHFQPLHGQISTDEGAKRPSGASQEPRASQAPKPPKPSAPCGAGSKRQLEKRGQLGALSLEIPCSDAKFPCSRRVVFPVLIVPVAKQHRLGMQAIRRFSPFSHP